MALSSFTGFLLFQTIEQFHQARLVRITHGRLAVWLDPFGMLDPQVIMNLFPQVCIGMGLVNHGIDLFTSPQTSR
jgi:hypothetical protein